MQMIVHGRHLFEDFNLLRPSSSLQVLPNYTDKGSPPFFFFNPTTAWKIIIEPIKKDSAKHLADTYFVWNLSASHYNALN